MDNEIYNNDDCNVNIVNVVDSALELTKLYYKIRGEHGYKVNENDIMETYLKFKKEIREDMKNED